MSCATSAFSSLSLFETDSMSFLSEVVLSRSPDLGLGEVMLSRREAASARPLATAAAAPLCSSGSFRVEWEERAGP